MKVEQTTFNRYGFSLWFCELICWRSFMNPVYEVGKGGGEDFESKADNRRKILCFVL
jgi:hypothetical protein